MTSSWRTSSTDSKRPALLKAMIKAVYVLVLGCTPSPTILQAAQSDEPRAATRSLQRTAAVLLLREVSATRLLKMDCRLEVAATTSCQCPESSSMQSARQQAATQLLHDTCSKASANHISNLFMARRCRGPPAHVLHILPWEDRCSSPPFVNVDCSAQPIKPRSAHDQQVVSYSVSCLPSLVHAAEHLDCLLRAAVAACGEHSTRVGSITALQRHDVCGLSTQAASE